MLCNTWLVTSQRGQPLHLDGHGRPRYVVRQLVDLREGRHPEDRLAWRATHDALTGLPNRSLFLDRLEMTLARLGRESTVAAVLVLDLDRFREVAERFGDDAVDRLLVAVAGRLRSILRPSDTVSRFGSDEFAVLCPDLAHERDAVRLAERMTAGLATPFAVGGQEIVVTASIGIALTGSRTRRASSLLSDADTALQRAKHRGGGLYELFDETVRAQLIERLELEQALRHAVDAGELRTLYQPIVSLKEGRLVGVEALVRWDQPGRGRLLPAEFVPFAEETGLIVPLGAWVLAESCRQAARWRANGPRTLPPTVHVNLSPRQFAEPHLIDLVAGALADTGTDPDRLCLEVTERALSANPASAATTLKRLSALGVRVSVDDFGTGSSSLASLQYLPLSSLKIDRSFVARLDLDPSDDAMVAAVIGLGHTLGLTVIAEGVETPAQLAKLDRLGCDYAQGHLFARPGPPPASASSSATTAAGSRVRRNPSGAPWCMDRRDRVRGGPTTGRTGTRRAGTRGRCARLCGAGPEVPGPRLPDGVRDRGRVGRRRGRRPGGVREGLVRAAAVQGRVAVPAVAAGDRGQRGPQPPPERPAPGRPGPAGRRGPPLGGRGPVPRGGGAGRRAAQAAAGRRRPAGRERPPGDRLPLLPGAVRGRDGRRPRLPAGHGEVAAVAGPRPPAGRHGRAGPAGGRPRRQAGR